MQRVAGRGAAGDDVDARTDAQRRSHRRAGVQHAGAAEGGGAVALQLLARRRARGTAATGVGSSAVVATAGRERPRAVACSAAAHLGRRQRGCADSISAAVPATSGDEKLVPTLTSKLSV